LSSPARPRFPFRPRLWESLRGYRREDLVADLGAGVTVALVALPLAMAFAIASGVRPEQGIVTAVVGGLIVSLFGGSKVQIAGPAGAFVGMLYAIAEKYGVANLLISTMMAGVLLFAMGALRLGTLVRFIPVSIVIGFTTGIAIIIALSQVSTLNAGRSTLHPHFGSSAAKASISGFTPCLPSRAFSAPTSPGHAP
jgi:SulP family sulfate permease